MTNSLRAQCYREAFERSFRKCASDLLVKQALSPRDALKIVVDPLRKKELSAIGERLFRQSTNSADPATRLSASIFPGYGQIRYVKGLQDDHAGQIANFKHLLSRVPKGSPEHTSLVNQVRDTAAHFRGQKSRAFEEIGAVAHPRMEGAKTLAQGGVGLGVGGAAGAGVGAYMGMGTGKLQDRQRMENAPLMERLRYSLFPQEGTSRILSKRAHFEKDAGIGHWAAKATLGGMAAGRTAGKGIASGYGIGKNIATGAARLGGMGMDAVGRGIRNPLRRAADAGSRTRHGIVNDYRTTMGWKPNILPPKQVGQVGSGRFLNKAIGGGALAAGGIAAFSPQSRENLQTNFTNWGNAAVSGAKKIPGVTPVANFAGGAVNMAGQGARAVAGGVNNAYQAAAPVVRQYGNNVVQGAQMLPGMVSGAFRGAQQAMQ